MLIGRSVEATALTDDEHPDYLDLPGVRLVRRTRERWKDGTQYWCLEAESIEPEQPHHHCKNPTIRPNGSKPFRMAHVPDGEMGREIVFMRRRWCCWGCGYSGLIEEVPYRTANRRMTERLYRYILRQVPDTGFRKIGRLTNLSEGTIRNIFKDAMREHDRQPVVAPLVLGIDEKWLFKGKKPLGVVCDVDLGKIVNITENRNGALKTFLANMKKRERTKVVTMDMHGPYKKWARDYFPNATVVADKWHVQKRADEAIDALRRHLADKEEAETKCRSKLRNLGSALLSRWHRLSTRQEARLRVIFARWPILAEAYHLKEDWYNIYDMATGPVEADAMFDSWDALVPEHLEPWFGRVMFQEDWREAVLAYFDWPYTNNFVESTNSKIGEMWRVGRSFSLDVLRFKLLIDPDTIRMPAATNKPRVSRIETHVLIADIKLVGGPFWKGTAFDLSYLIATRHRRISPTA